MEREFRLLRPLRPDANLAEDYYIRFRYYAPTTSVALEVGVCDDTGRYLALMAVGAGTVRVDDVRVARCMIDNVRMYDLTDGAVTLAWDTLALADGAGIAIEYGPHGFAPGSGTAVMATANPFTFRALCYCGGPGGTYYNGYGTSGNVATDQTSSIGVNTRQSIVATPYCMDYEQRG